MSSSMTPAVRRPRGKALLPAALLVFLVGCTGSDSPSSPTSTQPTAANAGSSGDAMQSSAPSEVNAGVTAAPSADEQEPMKTEDPEAEMASGSPSVTQDFSDDAGADLQEYEYPDDPEPAESVVATLCNLNRSYFTTLAESADTDLRMAVVGVTELLGYWESLVPHYPEVAEDVSTAGGVVAAWDEAVVARDNGDGAAADAAVAEANELIDSLPETAPADCVP